MNTINLTGNICQDIELKQTNSGKSVINFNLAVKRPFTKDTTDFIPVVVWEQPAEFLSKYAHKGSKIAVSGKLTSRNYEDKDGNKRTALEVVADTVEMCETASKNDTQGAQPTNTGTYTPSAYTQPQMSFASQTPQFEEIPGDESLPF